MSIRKSVHIYIYISWGVAGPSQDSSDHYRGFLWTFILPPLHGGGHTQHIPTQAWAFCFQCFESSSHPSHLILSRKSRHRPISGYCIMTFLHAVVAKVCVVLKCFLVEVSIWNLYVSTNTFQQITVKREFDTPVLMHRLKKTPSSKGTSRNETPRKHKRSFLCTEKNTWKVDGATPMYWLIMAPFYATIYFHYGVNWINGFHPFFGVFTVLPPWN